MSNTSIYILMHKNNTYYKSDNYYLLHTGTIFGKQFESDFYDNYGVNIAQKNPNYCELSGCYNIWANDLCKTKNIGFVHYRRYFTKHKFFRTPSNILSTIEMDRLLEKYDVILPRKWGNKKSAYERYYSDGAAGLKKDLDEVLKVIDELYPNYSKSMREIFSSKKISYFNMFVMSKENANEYFDWLFKVLFEVEKRVDLKNYNTKQLRIFGYLGEILLNVFVREKGFKIKYEYIFNPCLSLCAKLINKIKRR